MLGFFVIVAAFALFAQLYHDLKKQEIDSFKNYYMLGFSCALFLVNKYSFFDFILIIIVTSIFFNFLKKYMADGDREVIFWISLGLFSASGDILQPFYYLLALFSLLLIYNLLYSKVYKTDAVMPAMPQILGAFLLVVTI